MSIETPGAAEPLRAAQYVRMSTDRQIYSTENQMDAIAAYAARKNIEIVKAYKDDGRSGLLLKRRTAAFQKNRNTVHDRGLSCLLPLVEGRILIQGGSAMFRYLLLGACVSLCACNLTTSKTFTSPSGATANSAKCRFSPDGCFEKASQTCNGPYQILDSESHFGGLLTDDHAGHFTWYAMTYQCGPSDGKMPAFTLRNSTINANVNIRQQ
jgi:hypothetical protein